MKFAMTTKQSKPSVTVPAADYRATCIKLLPPKRVFRTHWTMQADFKLHTATGEVLSMYYDLGRGDGPNISPTSTAGRLWRSLYGQELPIDGGEIDFDRFTFADLVYTVKVETKKHKQSGFSYSKVTDVIGFAIGSNEWEI